MWLITNWDRQLCHFLTNPSCQFQELLTNRRIFELPIFAADNYTPENQASMFYCVRLRNKTDIWWKLRLIQERREHFIRLYSRSHGKYKSISERRRRINESTTSAVPWRTSCDTTNVANSIKKKSVINATHCDLTTIKHVEDVTFVRFQLLKVDWWKEENLNGPVVDFYRSNLRNV